MIHAKIVEDPGPVQAGSGETLDQCTNTLSSSERDYFRQRAAQEAEAARAASCCEARLAHEEMAEAYRLLCLSRKSNASSHFASNLSASLLNPRPTD